jgi:hypothetical protein
MLILFDFHFFLRHFRRQLMPPADAFFIRFDFSPVFARLPSPSATPSFSLPRWLITPIFIIFRGRYFADG